MFGHFYIAAGCYIVSLVLERTPKYRTSNTPNIEIPNIELSKHHILAQNRTLKMSNITKNQTVQEHQTVCSKTGIVTNNRTELQTLPNITFWPKTELRTCQTSQKTKQFANIELFVPRLMYI